MKINKTCMHLPQGHATLVSSHGTTLPKAKCAHRCSHDKPRKGAINTGKISSRMIVVPCSRVKHSCDQKHKTLREPRVRVRCSDDTNTLSSNPPDL
jgi:hypothetical protein